MQILPLLFIFSTLIDQFKFQLIVNQSPIFESDNSLKFDKITDCMNYLELLKIFAKENPKALVETLLQPYIKCSSPSVQDISNENCCQKIENAQFSLIEWSNYLHGHNDLEFLYAPNLYQGICHPNVCSAEELEENKQFIVEMIKQSGYDSVIMGGVEKVVVPGNSGNSTSGNSTSSENQTGNNTVDFQIFGDNFTPFKIRSTEQKRNIDDHVALFVIFIILICLPLILSAVMYGLRFFQKNTVNFLNIFDYKHHIQNFVPDEKSMRKGPLDIFNFLRVLGVVLVILIHQFQNQSLASNYHEVAEQSHSPFILLIYFSFEAVDMFLFMGGFFQAISMLPQKKLQKMSEGKLFGFLNVLKALFYRFLRVWPALLVNILIFTQIYYYLGNGPLWSMQEGEIESCDEYMFSNLLFIDNFGSDYTWKCFGHSWYLSVDFQLYLFCTLAIFIMCKNQIAGKIILWLTLIGCFVYNAYFLISNKILALDIADIAKFEQFTEDTTYYEVGMNFYRKPWARAPVFIMGLLFGSSYVNKEFVFSKKFNDFISKNELIQKVALFISFGIVVFLIYFPMPLLRSPYAYPKALQSVYFLFLPILTMITIMIFVNIMINMYNSGKHQTLVNFLSSRFIAVFAKISFMMYLTHLMIIKFRLFSQRQLQPWTVESLLGQYIFNFLISVFIATFLHLYVECPMTALTSLIQAPPKPAQKEQNQQLQEQASKQVAPLILEIKEQQGIENQREEKSLPCQVEENQIPASQCIAQNQLALNTIENENKDLNKQQQDNIQYQKLTLAEQNEKKQFQQQQQEEEKEKEEKISKKPLKNKIVRYVLAILAICVILGALLPLLFLKADDDIMTDIQKQNGLSYSISPDGERQVEVSFQDTEKLCFPNCKSCFGSKINQCYECLEPFQLHQSTSKCVYPEVTRSENQIQFKKQTLYADDSQQRLRNLQNQVRCPSNGQIPEYFVKMGSLAQKWVINFSSQEQWQDNSGDLPDILPDQQGFFDFEDGKNPYFNEFNYLTIFDCFDSEQGKKEQIIEDILQEIGEKFDLKIARTIIITSSDMTGYDLALEFGSKNKLKNIINKLFNLQPDIYLILDGISEKSDNYDLIKNLQIPTFFIAGDGFLSKYNEVCEQTEQTEEQKAKQQQFEKNKQIVVKKAQEPGNFIWNPPCFFDDLYLNIEAYSNFRINATKVNFFLIEWSKYFDNFKKNEHLTFISPKNPSLEEDNQQSCSDFYNPISDLQCYQEIYVKEIRTDFDENFQDEEEEFNEVQWENFVAYQLKENMGAKCADGTPPNVHFQQGIKKQRWLLHLKGWAWSLDWDSYEFEADIYKRFKYSKQYAANPNVMRYPDFSRSPFHDYNRADIVYCDPGSMRQGYSEDPIEIGGNQIWFRGDNNTIAQFDTLIQHFDMANSKEVILFGASSGGPTATIYINILEDMLHKINPHVKVKLITEGGMFLDSNKANSNEMTFRNSFFNGFYQYSNQGSVFPPNKECVEDQLEGEEWKCIFQQYAQKYVRPTIPTLLLNSGYDFSQVNRVKKMYCWGFEGDEGTPKKEWFDIGANCNESEFEIIEEYRTELYSILNDLRQYQPNLSVWVPSCSTHNFLNYQFNPDWQVPQDSGNTLYKITQEFLEGDKVAFLLDDVPYPQNVGCANTQP